jgi:hypothetical protein
MQIGLTKKLADEARIQIAPADASVDPLFSWSANVVTILRKKVLICMNDATRFAFFLNGVKAADYKRLDQMIIDGIRKCMAGEGIAPEVVGRYLSHAIADRGVTFTKTAGRKTVASLIQVMAFVGSMASYGAEEFPSWEHHLELNRIGVFDNKQVRSEPVVSFIEMLQARYSDPIIRSDAARLTVTLNLGIKSAVRRLLVPTFYTFAELHQVIQSVYRWRDYHLHQFVLAENERGVPTEVLVCYKDDEESAHSRFDTDVRLSEVFDKRVLPKAIAYEYDFGDGWEHIIQCEGIRVNYNRSYAQCTAMEGDAPPEDAGGPGGFQHMLDILADKTHPGYAEMKAWADGMRWKPLVEGDMARTNLRLKRRRYGYDWL